MRNTPLSTLLTMLKAAVGDSLTVGSQLDATYKQLLADKQQWLAGEFDFSFLVQRWNVAATAGTRYYNFPTTTVSGLTSTNISFNRPVKLFVTWTNHWIEVLYGASETTEFNYLNPDTNLGNWAQQALDPVQRWQEVDQLRFEVWPIPVTAQTLRFVGQRQLSALSANSDTADLDDQYLVLSLAVDILSKRESKDAQIKLSYCQERLRMLKATNPVRNRQVVLGGQRMSRAQFRRVPIIAVAGPVSP